MSGTLRRKIDESIEKKIVSKNLLLLLLNYYFYQIAYKTPSESEVNNYLEDIDKITRILRANENSGIDEYIEAVKVAVDKNQELSKRHLMSERQAVNTLSLTKDEYTYESGFIRDVLFKLVKRIVNGVLDKKDLKQYILDNDKIEYILENIGCQSIRFVSHLKGDDYYQCTNPDGGNNKHAVRVYTNEYLNVQDFTRNLGDVADIFTLVQLSKGLNFSQAVLYVNQILGLSNLSDAELRLLSIETEAQRAIAEQEEKKRQETRKQEERRLYREALEKDKRTYDCSEPLVFEDWHKEGITNFEPVRRKFGIRFYEYDGKYQKIIFPIRDWNTGNVVAYQKRFVYGSKDEEYLRLAMGYPKYSLTEGYDKNKNLYGLWDNKDDILENRRITIFESPKSVIKRWQLQDFSCVALGGKTVSWEQTGIIGKIFRDLFYDTCWNIEKYVYPEVVIALDKDVPEEDIKRVCRYLRSHSDGYYNISYIYDKWGILKDKESPADVSNKKYKYLFDNRIKYAWREEGR